ncbi:gluconolactonase precursor [Phyllosticta citrichinensis]
MFKVVTLAEKTLKHEHSRALQNGAGGGVATNGAVTTTNGHADAHALLAWGKKAAKTPFVIYDASALKVFGPKPKLACILSHSSHPFAHEAGVYDRNTRSVFITSNRYPDARHGEQTITVSRLRRPVGASDKWTWEQLDTPGVVMGNGGTNYADGVLFCAQGDFCYPSALVHMETEPPYHCTTLLNHYHGREFNSVNDVVVKSDGSIWFTDPVYGYEQGFRPRPQLPGQVYRFEPDTGHVRVVADGFGRCNGICFSPDERTVYVTDTEWIYGDGSTDDMRVSTIYAFDVCDYHGSHFLCNRHVFAMADCGVPDGIKCDTYGNVYAGCGDGLNIWNPAGRLVAKVKVDGGVANFCFCDPGEIVLLNETKVWLLQLDPATKGALKI